MRIVDGWKSLGKNYLNRDTIHAIVGFVFVFSGALGLIYQIVWFKYLSLFLGNTTYAQTIVLATFMGGLAIGSSLWGRKSDRVKRPLQLYALLEIGIGLYCFFYPNFLHFLQNGFISIIVSSQLPSGSTSVLLLKLLISLCTLLLPTILMGGTLPVLVRFISQRIEEAGKTIAILYFLNSLGAVLGSLLAGFFLIRILGLQLTIYVTAVTNLFIGVGAYLLATIDGRPGIVETTKSEASLFLFTRREVYIAITIAGISGLASMVYEVTWVRLLIPILGSSIYSFALMLVAFITGITFGSLIVSILVQRVKNLLVLLAWCQIGIVISMVVALPFYSRIPYEFWRVSSLLTRTDASYPIFLVLQFCIGIVLMIVPTIFLGMSLPVATRISSRSIELLGNSVGNIFAINTFGTVIGSLSAGLVLIPLVGVRHTIEIGIGCNLIAGLIILFFTNAFSRRQKFVVVSILGLFLFSYAVFSPNWNRGAMLAGVFRNINSNMDPPKTYREFELQTNAIRVHYFKEGITATIGVVEGKTSTGLQKVLIVNGKPDASSKGDLPTQVLLGQLGCLIHPNPNKALVIGLGSGVTVGSMLTHPLEHVDCVEISPEVVEASSEFNEVNYLPLKDPRMTIHIEDALAFLKIAQTKYDIIVSEPSNPWIAGVGSLYTIEFFEQCKQRMNSNGLMIQWFHIYEMDDKIFKMVTRTFQSSFSYVSMWQPQHGDVILIGSQQDIVIDFSKIKEAIRLPSVSQDLQRISISDMASVLSLEMLSPRAIRQYVGVDELNTEDHPYLEYGAPRAFFVNKGVQLAPFDERLQYDSVGLQLKRYVKYRPLTSEELWNIVLLHSDQAKGNLRFAYGILNELLKENPQHKQYLAKIVDVSDRLQRPEEALRYRTELLQLQPNNPDVIAAYGWAKYAMERSKATSLTSMDTKEYEQLLQKSISLVSDTVDRYRARLADLYFGTQRYRKAMDQYARTIQIRGSYQGDPNIQDDILFLQLARCFYQLEQNDKAASYALTAVRINPQNQEAKDLFYEIWTGGTKDK